MTEHFVLFLDCHNVTQETDLNRYFTDAVWDLLSGHPKFIALSSEDNLRQIFADELSMLERGPLASLREKNSSRVDEEIALYLARQFQDKDRFLNRLARFLYKNRFTRFILVFDNVDQLPIPLQEKVIQFAHSKMSEYNAFVLLSMWEETYFASKRAGRSLATMRTVPMQIARQSTSAVILKRLQYLINQVKSGKEPLTLLDERFCDRDTFCQFLELILRSLLVSNRHVRIFLELVALGNIRASLEMFHAFLTAGSFDTGKIINLMSKYEEYLVPVHEFIKSVMLGSKKYYSERTSPIINMFSIGDVEMPSHFTRLRLLQWLYERRHEATTYGNGFMTIPRVADYCLGMGISRVDARASLRRLVENALVENDIRAQTLLEESEAVRITATGRYYLTRLYRMFAYMDLVMQDTPFLDESSFREVVRRCESPDMEIRFERCDTFLDYLAGQEEEELITLDKLGRDVTWQKRFIPAMRAAYENEKRVIINKGYF